MTLTVYAPNCTSCDSRLRPSLSLLQSYVWANGGRLQLKSTAHDMVNRNEAFERLGLSNGRSHEAFVWCKETNKTVTLEGLTRERLAAIV